MFSIAYFCIVWDNGCKKIGIALATMIYDALLWVLYHLANLFSFRSRNSNVSSSSRSIVNFTFGCCWFKVVSRVSAARTERIAFRLSSSYLQYKAKLHLGSILRSILPREHWAQWTSRGNQSTWLKCSLLKRKGTSLTQTCKSTFRALAGCEWPDTSSKISFTGTLVNRDVTLQDTRHCPTNWLSLECHSDEMCLVSKALSALLWLDLSVPPVI